MLSAFTQEIYFIICTANNIAKKLNCDFNNGDLFCGWKDDPRDQTAAWESMNYGSIIGDAACMRPVGSKILNIKKHSARLWSSWLSLETDKKKGICLTFIYRIDMTNGFDNGNADDTPATLSLLKHSVGYGFFYSIPCLYFGLNSLRF